MSDKIAISRETLTVLADEHCPYGLLMAAKAIARDLLAKPPLIGALHDNGELIALEATVAQQAAMIEHLLGGPTPLYTAVDMANAARDGFRDGKASRDDALRLARRTLWIAFNWNDHNFGPAHLQARKEAEELGITTFEQANAWLEAQG